MHGTPNSHLPWLAALAAAALALSSCSQAITTALPDLTPSDRHVLSSAEQERAIKEMIDRKDSHQSTAIDAIAKAKAP